MLHPADAYENGNPAREGESAGLLDGQQLMHQYFVAGGVYQDPQGNEHFALLGPDRQESPYVMIDGVRRYFNRLSGMATSTGWKMTTPFPWWPPHPRPWNGASRPRKR